MPDELDDLTASIVANPSDAWLYHRRGWLHADARRWGLALADFDRAVALEPDEIEFRLSRGRLIGHVGGALGVAEGDFAHAMKREPGSVRAYVLCGRMHHYWHHSAQAIACFDRAIELEPEVAAHRTDRAEALAYLGDLPGALEGYAESIRLDPGAASVYWKRAYARLRYNPDVAPEDALPDLEAAIRLDPATLWYRHERGYIRFLRGEWAGAAADFACQDIPYKYSMCKYLGAEVAIWFHLAQVFAGEEALGRQFIEDFLRWYGAECSAAPGVKEFGTTGDWPILLALLLLGRVDAREVEGILIAERAKPGLVPCEIEPIDERLLELRFVRGELALASADRAGALDNLEAARGLPAWNPMRRVADHQVADLRAGGRPGVDPC